MDVLKKYVDSIMVLGSVIGALLWMNGKFNDFEGQIHEVSLQCKDIEKDVAVIKTIMILKNIMPPELVHKDE